MTTPSEANLELLLSRRSASSLGPPAPTREQLDRILSAAGTVPDHGALRPYRFIVVEDEGRGLFGDALARTVAEKRPTMPTAGLEKVRGKAFRSPLSIVLVASPKEGKIEPWEQRVTAGCTGYAILLAARALGLGAVWKSMPFTKSAALDEVLQLGPAEEMLGWIHLGTDVERDALPARTPFDPSTATTSLGAGGARAYERATSETGMPERT